MCKNEPNDRLPSRWATVAKRQSTLILSRDKMRKSRPLRQKAVWLQPCPPLLSVAWAAVNVSSNRNAEGGQYIEQTVPNWPFYNVLREPSIDRLSLHCRLTHEEVFDSFDFSQQTLKWRLETVSCVANSLNFVGAKLFAMSPAAGEGEGSSV